MTKSETNFLGGRRLIALVLALLVVLSLVYLPSDVKAATSQDPNVSRLIYVVYDDSNSMIRTGGKANTAWSEAKYSLEILSAMMQEKDSMSVYYMSDFYNGYMDTPRLSNLSGAASQRQNNISKIHNTVTETQGTPFESINKAYNDLKEQAQSGAYDEYHLVVLTDGNTFDYGETSYHLDDLFSTAKDSDVQVVYLAIGSDAIKPTPKPDGGVYVYSATPNSVGSSDSILNKVTEMGERIFQRPAHATNGNTLDLKVPVSEIIVFAQGANISVGDLSGTHKSQFSAGVTDKDKDKASAHADRVMTGGPHSFIVAEGLTGAVVTFTPSSGDYIPEGTYQLDISATSYTVYYKPCLDVSLELKDADGNVVENGNEVNIGTYTADYFLTYPESHPNHGKKVDLSGLGIDPAYLLTVSTDGLPTIHMGAGPKNIDLGEGQTRVTVTAKYLTYISTDSSINFAVADFEVYELRAELTPNKLEYVLSEMNGRSDVFTVKVTNSEGNPLTDEEWNLCQLKINCDGVDFTAPVKNADHTFTFRPTLKNGSYQETASGDVSFTASVTMSEGNRVTHKGTVNGVVSIYNDVIPDEALGGFSVSIKKINPSKIESTNFNGVSPTAKLEISWNGNPLTKEQYDALKLNVEMSHEEDTDLVTPSIVLDPYVEGEPTTATVTFAADGDDETLRTQLHKQDLFKVSATINREGFENKASAEGDLNVDRVWSFMEILGIILLFAFILFILFGYIICKKWLPTKIKYSNDLSESTFKPYSRPSIIPSILCPFLNVICNMRVDYFDDSQCIASCNLKIQAKSKKEAIVLNSVELYQNGDIYVDDDTKLSNYIEMSPERRAKAKKPYGKLKFRSSHIYKGGSDVITFLPVPKKRKHRRR